MGAYIISYSILPVLKNRIIKKLGLYRDYWFFKANIRYISRILVGLHEWKNILEKPPILLGFNTTDLCNAKCCYCAHRYHESADVMDMDIFIKGVRDFNEMGGGTIGLSPLTGEPLLDPYLFDRIEFASRSDNIHKITFNTNGIMLRDNKIRDELIRLSSEIQIEIYISLPGFEKEMFERVYNTEWDNNILIGIKELLLLNRRHNNAINIILSLQPDLEGILEDQLFDKQILPLIDKENIEIGEMLRDNWCGQVKQQHLTGDFILKRNPVFKRIPCEVLLDRHVDVLADGNVRMCGCRFGIEGKNDELILGNMMDESLSDIWFGEKAKKICGNIINGDIPIPCQQCSMYMPY